GRWHFQRRVEITADDARRDIIAAVHPRQQLLHLKQAQRIIPAGHVEVRHMHIDQRLLDGDARDQRHHVPRAVVQVAGLEDREAGQQRLSFDLGEAVYTRLLDEVVFDADALPSSLLYPTCRLLWDAHLVQRENVGPDGTQLLDDQLAACVPPFV